MIKRKANGKDTINIAQPYIQRIKAKRAHSKRIIEIKWRYLFYYIAKFIVSKTTGLNRLYQDILSSLKVFLTKSLM